MMTYTKLHNSPCYLIEYFQPEYMVLGYTHDINVLRWLYRNIPNANFRVTEYANVDDMERDIEYREWYDSRIMSNELISVLSDDCAYGFYPPVFNEDDCIGDIAWEEYFCEAKEYVRYVKVMLQYMRDEKIARLIETSLDILNWCIEEYTRPRHYNSYWTDDVCDDLFDMGKIIARYLLTNEGGIMYYYGEY